MDEKLTNRQARDLYESLNQLNGSLPGVKFNYAISRTSKKLEPIIKSLEIAQKPSDSFVEFENKRIQLMETYCDVDPKGNPLKEIVGKQVQYSITQKLGLFQKALTKLSKEFKETIQQRESQLKEFEAFLDKAVDDNISLHMISLEEVPENITRQDFKRIEMLIEEE